MLTFQCCMLWADNRVTALHYTYDLTQRNVHISKADSTDKAMMFFLDFRTDKRGIFLLDLSKMLNLSCDVSFTFIKYACEVPSVNTEAVYLANWAPGNIFWTLEWRQ